MDLDLSGKHALVCGATQGIGLATARALAELGADVTLLARREDVLREVAAALPCPQPGQAHGWVSADAADTESLRAKVEALAAGKPVHILVNNSGGPPPGTVHGTDIAAFEAAYRQHLLANHVLAEAVIPGMERDGYGRIVNVISTSVKEPISGLGVSNTTRWAVASWAKTLAAELAAKGITVNTVAPGAIETDFGGGVVRDNPELNQHLAQMTALGRVGLPDDIGPMVAGLLAPANRWVTAQRIEVSGGQAL